MTRALPFAGRTHGPSARTLSGLCPGLLFTGSVRMLPGLRRGFCPPRTLLRSDLRAPRGPRFVQRRLGTRAAGRPWFPKTASPRHFPHSVFRPNGPYVALFRAPRTRFRSVVGPHLPPRKGRAEHCRTAWRQGNAAKGAPQGTPSGETSCDPVPTPVSFSCPRIAGTPSLASMIDRPSAPAVDCICHRWSGLHAEASLPQKGAGYVSGKTSSCVGVFECLCGGPVGAGWHPLVTARADGAVAGSGLYGLSPIDDLLRVAEKEDAERAKAGVMVVVGGALLLFAIIYFAVKAAQTKPKSFPPQPRQTKGTAARGSSRS